MAFPTRLSVTETVENSSVTTIDVSYPAVVVAGDLLVMCVTADFDDTGNEFVTPSGWTRKAWHGISGEVQHGIYVKSAVGNEDGATVAMVIGSSDTEDGSAIMVRYQVGTWSGDLADIEVSAQANGDKSTDEPNSGSLTHSAGSADYQWISVWGSDDGNLAVTAAPTNYSGEGDTLGDRSTGYAFRDNATATEDPGAFTTGAGIDIWIAFTVAVPPAGGGGGSPVTVTVPVLALTTTRYAPTVTATDNKTVTPGALALATTKYAPAAQLGPLTVTPGLLELATTRYAPALQFATVVTVPLLALMSARYAPSVHLGPLTVTVPLLALVSTRYAPVAGLGPLTVTPGLLALVTARYAPRLDESIPVGLLELATETFAPRLDESLPVGLLEIVTETFAPSPGQAVIARPPALGLALELYDPRLDETIPIGLLALVLQTLAPVLENALGKRHGRATLARISRQVAEIAPVQVARTGRRLADIGLVYVPRIDRGKTPPDL